MIVQSVLFPTVVVLYLYNVRVEIFDFEKKYNSSQKFLKIKSSILCEKFMKMEISVQMTIQNVLFPTVVDL